MGDKITSLRGFKRLLYKILENSGLAITNMFSLVQLFVQCGNNGSQKKIDCELLFRFIFAGGNYTTTDQGDALLFFPAY